ncbi:MAG TPA: Fic family protein [Steroidobacteraceae bacterium]|nr:Fic family protein [Steroidobacteraceae bacterium]
MISKRQAATGSEAEFQPGSRGRVLRNFLGVTRAGEMEEAETHALVAVQREARTTYGRNHRFTAADIRHLHRMWLGSIYPWAGNYRTVNIEKPGFQFAHAPLIPRLMARFGKEALRRHTPCREGTDVPVARSLAQVHAQLILIHPFRDGNARLARLLSVLMASQAGLNPLRLSALAGRGRRTYVQAIDAAKSGDYAPLETLFSCALDRPWRQAARPSDQNGQFD